MKTLLLFALPLCACSAAVQETATPSTAAQEIGQIARPGSLEAHAKPELLTEDVFDRLATLLEHIPKRWGNLPAAVVPVSGRSVEDVLEAASAEQTEEASQWFAHLRSIPSTELKVSIKAELSERPPTEYDLWLPSLLVESQQLKSFDEAALTLELWLQLAEALGRKDVLLFAAARSIDILKLRKDVGSLLPIVNIWIALPSTVGAERGQGALQRSLAAVLFFLGDNQQALEAYRRARLFFETVGYRIGVGSAWQGEADVLFRIDENQKALDAYQYARQFFSAARDELREGDTWFGEADVLFQSGENEKALAAYRNARKLFENSGSLLRQGNAWDAEADVLLFLGETEKALAAHRTARRLYEAVGSPLGQANTWKGEAEALSMLGEKTKALEAFRAARSFFKVVADQQSQGHTLVSEARVYFQLGENQAALDALRTARRLFVAIGSEVGQGNTWIGEGDILFFLGENQKALEAYRRARQLFPAGGSQLNQGNSWRGEGDVLFYLGENEKALEAYRTARQFFEGQGDQVGQGVSWFGEGDILSRLGENARALGAYRKARQLFQAMGDQLGQGSTWRAEADLLLSLGESQEALDAYRNARQFFESAGDQQGQGNAWRGEADLLLFLGEDQKALEAYRIARELFRADEDQLGQGDTWLGEARVLRKSMDWRGAVEAASTAIANFQQIDAVLEQIDALLLKAEVESRMGNATTAAASASEAIRLHAQWRKIWITDRHRTQGEETISLAYDILVPLYAKNVGAVSEALRLAEEARSRVLLDLLATAPTREEISPTSDLVKERQRLEVAIWEAEEQLRDANEPNRQAELRALRRHLDQELEWNRYQRIAIQEGSLAEEPPLDVAAIQALAQEAGPLLFFYVASQEVWGFLVLPETSEIALRSIAVSRDDLEQAIRAFARDLSNPLYERRTEAQAHKFWDLLISPFMDGIPLGRSLVIVPHGPLHGIPFEALLDPEGKRLFERWQVSITPSASALKFARRGHVEHLLSDSFLGFASGRGLNLPAGEVAEISSFFDTHKTAFRTTEANYQNYLKLVAQARHLLITTRGVHIEGSRTETYLEIEATPKIHDSRLTAAEIATIPLHAELVTLAACDTSHGRALLSDERLDLTRSFLIARAAAVLATRWKVPEDAATSRFLADFYRAYRRGGPQGTGMRKDEALTEARRRSRERGEPAQVWAAWVLVGDAR